MVGGNTREACGNGGKKAARHERAGAGRGWIPQQEKQAQQWQFKSEILASGNTRGSCQWQQRIIRWQLKSDILAIGNNRGVGSVWQIAEDQVVVCRHQIPQEQRQDWEELRSVSGHIVQWSTVVAVEQECHLIPQS